MAAILPSIAIGTHTVVHDIGKAPPGYRRAGSLATQGMVGVQGKGAVKPLKFR